ncbi:IS3 family transposase [Lactococcus sp.]
MKEILKDYIYWFNNVRRSNKLKYTISVFYRSRVF